MRRTHANTAHFHNTTSQHSTATKTLFTRIKQALANANDFGKTDPPQARHNFFVRVHFALLFALSKPLLRQHAFALAEIGATRPRQHTYRRRQFEQHDQ